MLRSTFHAAVALMTCLIGIAAADVWDAAGTLTESVSITEVAHPCERELDRVFATSDEGAEGEIRELMRRYDIAQTNHDATFFAQVEADDFILTYPDGETLTRAQAIKAMMSWPKDIKYTSDDLHIQFYGDVAIVTGRTTETHTGRESEYNLECRWVDQLVRRGGSWQILSTTLTY